VAVLVAAVIVATKVDPRIQTPGIIILPDMNLWALQEHINTLNRIKAREGYVRTLDNVKTGHLYNKNK
jgi:hypothetical protein